MSKRVALFATCLIDAIRPGIGMSVVKLLEFAGYEVAVPPQQTCCGQPAYNAGDRASALLLARKWLDEFESFDYVVMASGSCGGMVRRHYPDLFANDPDLQRRFAALTPRIYELCEFLTEVAALKQVPGNFQGRVTYHDSCSGLRELGIKLQPRQLLALMPGVQLQEMKDCEQCCGFGGAFAVKYGNISAAIADDKCRNASESGADVLVAGDLGCLLQIEGRLSRLAEQGQPPLQVRHIAELLAGDGNSLGT